MILNQSKHGDMYGISHNESSILLSVNGERAVLTPNECEELMHAMVFHLNEQRNGLWCGRAMRRSDMPPTREGPQIGCGMLESGSDSYADHP